MAPTRSRKPHRGVAFRADAELPPSALVITSPDDTQARYSRKKNTIWTGDTGPLTETGEADAPQLRVEVVTTAATTPDGQILGDLHEQLADQELWPEQHLVDMGYVDAEVLAQSHARDQVDLVGPVPPESPLARPRRLKASITASLPLMGKPTR